MKKTLIFVAIIIAIIVAMCVVTHYLPVWFSLTSVAVFVGGGICGWFVKAFYDKYIKN